MDKFTHLDLILSTYGYVAIFLIIFFAEMDISLPVPLPSELTLLFAGYKVFMHKLILVYVLLAGYLGDFLGALTLFLICYKLRNNKLVQKPLEKYRKNFSKLRLHEKLTHYSIPTILIGRLLPYARNYITIVSGLIQIDIKQFFLFSMVPSVIWVGTIVLMGVKLGPNIFQITQNFDDYKKIGITITIVLAIVFIGFIAYTFFHKGDEEEFHTNA